MPSSAVRTRRLPALFAPTLLAALVLALLPSPAQAEHLPESRCPEGRGICVAAYVKDGVQKLRITTVEGSYLAGQTYRLCVTGPDGSGTCKTFELSDGADGRPRDVKQWHQHFPYEGNGEYTAVWRPYRQSGRLVAPIGFHVTSEPPPPDTRYPRRHCAEERDYCIATFVDGVRKFRISSAFGTFTGRYRLCVAGPDARECKEFRMESADEPGERNRDVKRWRRHFTHQGVGQYTVSWHKDGRIGPVLGFRVHS